MIYAAILILYTSLYNFQICTSESDIYEYLKHDIEDFAQKQYPETSQLSSHYDFIIVGAGTAGCAVANRLSEISDWKILLIEAGGHESRRHDIPENSGSLQYTDVDWAYVSEPSKTFALGLEQQRVFLPRGKVVGGTSVINSMVYNRGNPEDYNRWENIYNNPGWSYDKIEKYFKRLENYAINNTNVENFFGKNGPMHIEEPPYHSELSNALLEAGEQYGFKLIDTNLPDQLGISRARVKTKNGYRFSANSAYLVPIHKSRPNLELKLNCLVTKILISNEKFKPKATGVTFTCPESQNYTIYARKEVIISAGAINSPQLLMVSGIGPAKHLQEMGIPVVKNLAVGRNLMDHIKCINIQFLVNKTIFPEQKEKYYIANRSGPLSIPGHIEVIAFSHPYEKVQTVEQLFLSSPRSEGFLKRLRLKKEIYKAVFEPYTSGPAFTILSQLIKPKSRGVIRLRNKNPFVPPRIFLNYFSNREDITILIKAIREAIKIAQQPALKAWNATLIPNKIPQCSKYKFNSDKYWACSIITIATTNYHQCGTCKMGSRNDPTSVVDSELRVHGVDNLRVVDASIMPEILAAHIVGPVIMIGEKAADMIKFSYGRQ